MASGAFSFQRTEDAVLLTTTTGGSASAAFNLAHGEHAEIANTNTLNASAFVFTDAGASSATAATTNMRTIPPNATLREHLPQGASFVAGIALTLGEGGDTTLIFTPGVSNG